MSYTEWVVSKDPSASDVNGGGINCDVDGGPVITRTNCSTNPGGTQIVNDDATGWGSAQVGDPVCVDTAGSKDPSIITNIAGDTLTVAPAVSAAIVNKTVNVGGHWATVDHATSTMDAVMLDPSGNPPCINLKYHATDYSEQVQLDNSGTTLVPMTLDGYESSAHDGCPNGNRPTISSAAGALAGVVYAAAGIDHWRIRNLISEASGAGIAAISMTSDYSQFEKLTIAAAGAGADGLQNTNGYYCRYQNSECSAPTYAFRGGYYASIRRVHGRAAGTACLEAKAGSVFERCIAFGTGATTYGILLNSGPSAVYSSTLYNCGTGVHAASNTCEVRGCIFESCSTAGVRTIAGVTFSHRCDWNYFYNNAADYHATTMFNYGGEHDVSLTASPFANAAGGDFRLNGVAGGGALVRANLQAHIDALNSDCLDGGALQTPDSAKLVGSGGLVG